MAYAQIYRWDSDDYDAPYDVWVACEQAYQIADLSNIRISRTKELRFVALDDIDNVIGAIWVHIYADSSYFADSEYSDIMVYDFDVAVHPQHRNHSMIGLRLIEAAIQDYKESLPDDRRMIKVFVVNRRLSQILHKKYDFEDTGWSSSGTEMYYYG